MKDYISQHPTQHVYPHKRGNKNSFYRCHHYGRYGYITPFWYRLYGYPQSYSQSRLNGKKQKKTQGMKEWKPKEVITCLIAHTSLGVFSREDWYFGSGCSRHMTGEKSYIEDLSPTQIVMPLLVMEIEEKSRACANWLVQVSLVLMMCCW